MNYPEGCFPRYSPPRTNEGWHHVNRRPDQQVTDRFGQEIPVCPHSQLIEICSNLVGPQRNGQRLAERDEYCGKMGEYTDSIGILSGFRGMIYEPRSTCSQVHNALKKQVDLMKQVVVPDTVAMEQLRRSSITLTELSEHLKTYMDALNLNEEQRQIFLRWQYVIFDNCCMPAQPNTIGESTMPLTLWEKEDPHFKRVNSPADLTFEEVIQQVESFLEALGKTTGNNCPQAPEREETGMRSFRFATEGLHLR